MKNLLKRLSFIALSACIVFTAVFAAACQKEDNDPASVGYSVTVLYPDGSPVKATASNNPRALVSVTLQDKDGKDVTAYENGILDEYGTAHTDYKIPGEYKIAIYNIPEGYAYDPVVTTTADAAKYTITLVNNTLAYEIEVKLPDGSPYTGKSVKLLKNGNEVASLTTDAQGKALTETIAADNYDVVVDVPKDYGYKPVTTSKSDAKTTVTLFSVHKIEFKNDEIADADTMKIWDEARNDAATFFTPVDLSVNNYLYTADVKDGGEYFFRICAPWTGRYAVHCKTDDDPEIIKDNAGNVIEKRSNYEILFYKDNFGKPINDWTLTGTTNNGNNSMFLDLEEGDEYIISVKSRSGEAYKMQFLMAYNVQPYVAETSQTGTYKLNYDNINYAELRFRPEESGIYEITSLNNEFDPELIAIAPTTNRPLPGDYYSEYYGSEVSGAYRNGEDLNFVFEETVANGEVGNIYIYRITLKGSFTSPASLDVKIERTGDAPPEIVYDRVTVTPAASLAKQSKPAGSWTWLDADGEEPVERDGNWYVTVDGNEKQVYVAITKNLDGHNNVIEYSFATREYMGEAGYVPPKEDGTHEKQNGALSLTVFAEYKVYLYSGFIETYSGYCTDDGCYALNGELKTFLERYTANYWTDLALNPNVKPAHAWLLGCGYYS